jgi:hypothetical protein
VGRRKKPEAGMQMPIETVDQVVSDIEARADQILRGERDNYTAEEIAELLLSLAKRVQLADPAE